MSELYQIFQGTLSPDGDIRKQAEQALKLAELQDGSLQAVLLIVRSPQSDAGVRKAAAIFFKNRVRKDWEIDSGDMSRAVGPADRAVIRQEILPAIVELPQSLSVFLTSALTNILDTDFPEKWPNFIDVVMGLLRSDNPSAIYGGLLGLHSLVKHLGYSREKSELLNKVTHVTFGAVFEIATKLSEIGGSDAMTMLRVAIKIYLGSIRVEMAPELMESKSLVPWGTLFVKIVEMEIPFEDVASLSEEEREKHPSWRVKKWAYRALHHYLQRFCNDKKDEEKYKNFSETFLQHFAPNVLTSYLGQMSKCVSGVWMSSRVRQQLACFIADCVKHKSTWAVLKPHAQVVVESFIFPQLCFNNEDAELWQEDPIEYIQKKIGDDFMEQRINPVAAAEDLLSELASKRFKQTFASILGLVQTVVDKYNSLPVHERDARQKVGALRILRAVSSQIMKSPYSTQMEAFFITHVFPEFASPHGFMRALACDMLMYFRNIKFSLESQRVLLQGVLQCLQDAELPVKIYAAQSIMVVIEYDLIVDGLKPHIADIMNLLLELTSKIDMDALTNVMERLAVKFSDEIAPFSIELCTRMRESFMSILHDVTNNEEYFEKNLAPLEAAMGILKAITALIVAVDSSPEILAQLDNIMVPVILHILQNEHSELYTEAFELTDALTFCSKSISAGMWHVFPEVYKCLLADHDLYLEDVMPSIDNFITFGRDVIAQNPQMIIQIMEMISAILTNNDIDMDYKFYGCLIAESALLNLRGSLDEHLPKLVTMALEQYKAGIEAKMTQIIKIHLLEMLINCVYYNPVLTLQLLDQAGATAPFFDAWLQEVPSFTRVHDKKLSIMAFSAILSSPLDLLPTAQQYVVRLFDGMLQIYEELPKALEERERAMTSGQEDDDDDDEATGPSTDEFEEDADEDGDVEDEEDEEYAEYLANFGNDNFVEEDLEEDPDFVTPLDNIDAYVHFSQFLGQLQSSAVFGIVQSSLNPEKQAFIQNLLQTAEQNKLKATQN